MYSQVSSDQTSNKKCSLIHERVAIQLHSAYSCVDSDNFLHAASSIIAPTLHHRIKNRIHVTVPMHPGKLGAYVWVWRTKVEKARRNVEATNGGLLD